MRGLSLGFGLMPSFVGAPWTPAALTPNLWFRADLGITTSAGAVTQWVDQANGLIATPKSTNPTYNTSDSGILSKPSITLNGTSDALIIPYNALLQPASVSLLGVWRYTTSGAGSYSPLICNQIDASWTDGWAMGEMGVGNFGGFAKVYTTNYSTSDAALTNNSWRSSAFTFDPAGALNQAAKLYINGAGPQATRASPASPGNINYSGNNKSAIGAYFSNNGASTLASFFPGVIAELIMVPRVITALEIASFESYCQSRYGTP